MILKHEHYWTNMLFQDFLKKWRVFPLFSIYKKEKQSLTATASREFSPVTWINPPPSPRHVRESKRISKLLAVWIRTASRGKGRALHLRMALPSWSTVNMTIDGNMSRNINVKISTYVYIHICSCIYCVIIFVFTFIICIYKILKSSTFHCIDSISL